MKKYILIIILIIFGLVSGVICFIFEYDFLNKEHIPTIKKNSIYDFYGVLVDVSDKKYTFFNQVPKSLINAFVASEDRHFFRHNGISIRAILRSIKTNILARKYVQGASTITQQMIKLSYNQNQKTLKRKIKEQLLALLCEIRYLKEDIFERYMNILYFGKGIYGICAASQVFWHKEPKDLTIAQSATIAAIIKLPERYNPFNNPSACEEKRNFVLRKMYECRFITKEEYEFALAEPLDISKNESIMYAKNFYASLQELMKKNDIKQDQVTIYSYYKPDIQKIVCTHIEKYLTELNKKAKMLKLQAACVILDSETGGVVAAYNGRLSHQISLPRTFYARHVASTIKPLIMYFALSKGDLVDTLYEDEPLIMDSGWRPSNNNREFGGCMTLQKAIIQSNNIIPTKVLLKYDIVDFVDLAKKINCFFNVCPYYSIALGCVDSNVFLMSSYILMFFNEGTYIHPAFARMIISDKRNISYKHCTEQKILLDKTICQAVKKTMSKIAKNICKKTKQKYPDGLICKTGTAAHAQTCWFVGATKKYAIALWIGTDMQENLDEYGIKSIHAALCGISIFNAL